MLEMDIPAPAKNVAIVSVHIMGVWMLKALNLIWNLLWPTCQGQQFGQPSQVLEICRKNSLPILKQLYPTLVGYIFHGNSTI